MCDAMPLLVELPEEILVDEILARLPVKSLSRFKCVSKSWRSLIKSDQLFKVHYQNSAKNPRVITMSLKAQGINAGCSLQSLLESEEGSDSNPTKNEPKEGVLVGCCNGVVCFYNFRGYRKFTLWNPATSVSVELLPHNGGAPVLGKSGFGWDESTGAYKVFAVLYHEYEHHLKRGSIYSSDTNSWRTISPVPDSSTSDARGVFLRGNLHWVDGRHSQIELLNLESEEFGRIDMPLISSNDRIDLGVIGGNLSILIDLEKGFEVWMMKEYGVKDSWLKTLTFHSTLSWPTRCVTRPLFGEGPNGEIFVIYGETLIIYSPKDDASSTATNKVCFFEALVYVESLVSPKTILGV